LYNNLDSYRDIHCALGQLKKEEIDGFLLTIAHFTNAQSIHSGSYKQKTINDKNSLFRNWPLIPIFL
jgi:hypothetical protein